MESWQVIYLVLIFTGLLAGWIFSPLIGLAIIVVGLVLTETFTSLKRRSKAEMEET